MIYFLALLSPPTPTSADKNNQAAAGTGTAATSKVLTVFNTSAANNE